MSQWEEDFPDDEVCTNVRAMACFCGVHDDFFSETFYPSFLLHPISKVMSPRKEVGKGLSELPMDDLAFDGNPEDECDVPSPPKMESEQSEVPFDNEQQVAPLESEPPGIPVDSEQPSILSENDQPVPPLESEKPVIPIESEQPEIPLESDLPPIPGGSEPRSETEGLVTETKAIALENPSTPVAMPSPSVTTIVLENKPVPEKVVKSRVVAAVLERKEPEETGGNKIPKSGDLVQDVEVWLYADMEESVQRKDTQLSFLIPCLH